ncbi:malonyl-ACP O-methyltransferase BioC [Vibrio ishigakensis]|uniref:malonyl-ACP O-methyltransferase BioC n=1 Tax=Vibrio ishigakensis TaxID=1481914 RepID=UPI0021C3FD1A|nr:malonyl-ACP O-methyltransferase BioC [Vibrio ishigakensis]
MTVLAQNKIEIAEAFGRAAMNYDRHAEFQRDVVERLLDYLPDDLSGIKALDVGSGTGYFAEKLLQRGAEVTCLDISSAMLSQAEQRLGASAQYCLADAESIPFDDNDFDLVVSSLAVQWCDDLTKPLIEMQRVCAFGGRVLFSTLAEGSLFELKQAWRCIDDYQHVNTFLSEKQIKFALAQSSTSHYRIDFPKITLWYTSALQLMRDLKGIGATRVSGRSAGLTKPSILSRVDGHYRELFQQNQQLPATYRVCLGIIDK